MEAWHVLTTITVLNNKEKPNEYNDDKDKTLMHI